MSNNNSSTPATTSSVQSPQPLNLQQAALALAFWGLVIPGALILAITMGARQSMGLFISPLNTSTGLGIAAISFALAVGQFMWGASQPIFGAIADRYGPGRVIVLGGVILAAGTFLTTQFTSQWGLIFSMGILSAAGAGAGSFSILISAAAQRLPAQRRSFASGLINAGGSVGQAIFAPLAQLWIAGLGWVKAMWILAAISLLTLPLAYPLRRRTAPTVASGSATAAPVSELTLREQLKVAFKDKSYWCLHAGFLTCGFHIAFLVTHLPQEVGLCGLTPNVSATALALIGLANIAGSLGAGYLGGKYRMKYLLFWMYLSRAVIVLLYMAAPKTPATFYAFAIALGLTWLATVPPTAGLVGKLFGVRYLATLFGLTLLSHQIGGFFGAWLGGLALQNLGNYQWMWYADIVLAIAAALINLPISEQRVQNPQARAAS
jgi:predicted MFS family arabinose efflux permease